jgi:hypothetical protein
MFAQVTYGVKVFVAVAEPSFSQTTQEVLRGSFVLMLTCGSAELAATPPPSGSWPDGQTASALLCVFGPWVLLGPTVMP